MTTQETRGKQRKRRNMKQMCMQHILPSLQVSWRCAFEPELENTATLAAHRGGHVPNTSTACVHENVCPQCVLKFGFSTSRPAGRGRGLIFATHQHSPLRGEGRGICGGAMGRKELCRWHTTEGRGAVGHGTAAVWAGGWGVVVGVLDGSDGSEDCMWQVWAFPLPLHVDGSFRAVLFPAWVVPHTHRKHRPVRCRGTQWSFTDSQGIHSCGPGGPSSFVPPHRRPAGRMSEAPQNLLAIYTPTGWACFWMRCWRRPAGQPSARNGGGAATWAMGGATSAISWAVMLVGRPTVVWEALAGAPRSTDGRRGHLQGCPGQGTFSAWTVACRRVPPLRWMRTRAPHVRVHWCPSISPNPFPWRHLFWLVVQAQMA